MSMILLLPLSTSITAKLELELDFVLVQRSIDVYGYQLYAVEKWLLERNRPVHLLIVYTGHPSHKISLSALSPSPTHPHPHLQWENAINLLKSDGARPKQTPHGVLMATSLAHFRSDYTIVHIPDGNYTSLVRDQLYTNINLLRMGCSGRTALTLEEPTNVTKSRFVSVYHLPDSISSPTTAITSTETLPLLPRSQSHSHSRSNSVLSFKHLTDSSPSSPPKNNSISKAIGIGLLPPKPDTKPSLSLSTSSFSPPLHKLPAFTATVLELVKLIQAGLSIFGMYNAPRDGLLCDITVHGIHKWIVDIGDPCLGLEPMERVADPSFVAALVSLVLSIRNKLATLGFSHLVPKDPFLHPHLFLHALSFYIHPTTSHHDTGSTATTPGTSHHTSTSYGFGSPGTHVFLPHHRSGSTTLPVPPQMTTPSTSGSSASASNPHPPQAVLTRDLVNAIAAAYDSKVRSADGRGVTGHGGRMRKAFRGKLRTGTTTAAVESDGDGVGATSGGEASGAGIDRDSSGAAGVVATSGGQILSGIGSIASGLGLGVGAGSGSSTTGAGALVEPTCDMGSLVKSIYSKPKTRKTITKMYDVSGVVAAGTGAGGVGGTSAASAGVGTGTSTGAGGESLGIGYGYGHAYYGKEKEKDKGVGVSVKALWSGQVASILRLREWELEKERMGASPLSGERKKERVSTIGGGGGTRDNNRDRWALSDGEVDDQVRTAAKSDTEEESDPPFQSAMFGGMWGERMQRKLGSWAGLARKRGHMSVDMAMSTSRGENATGSKHSLLGDSLTTTNTRPNMPRGGSMPISPTLPPIVFVGRDGDADDDDLLSSGQVSPIENPRPTPFHLLHDGPSLESSNHNSDYERKVTEFNLKRPWANRMSQSRISSWADPVSARSGLVGDEEGAVEAEAKVSVDAGVGKAAAVKRKRGDTIASFMGGESMLSEEPETIWEDDDEGRASFVEGEGIPTRRTEMYGPKRRRSFHDLDSLQGMRTLAVERMRIDVELSAQLLIMTRREQHLRNVLSCLQVLTNTLSNTNTSLREDHQSHLPILSDLEAHTQIISTIDAENAKADKTSQATHTLRYEAEQFRIPDLWHTVTPPRHKVLELREKVFGTGGRRLPQGVHGAHGKFNRLQWTLDDRERLVDHLGRTESEAEEEEPGFRYLAMPEEEEEDVVEHASIKPMWLLRFFTSWGARWGAPTVAVATPQTAEDDAAKYTSGETTPQTQHTHDKDNGNDDSTAQKVASS